MHSPMDWSPLNITKDNAVSQTHGVAWSLISTGVKENKTERVRARIKINNDCVVLRD